MTRIFNPPHPGETLREDVLPELGLTVTEAADQLGVTRAALSRVLNGHAAISPEMALRLGQCLGVRNNATPRGRVMVYGLAIMQLRRERCGRNGGQRCFRRGARCALLRSHQQFGRGS